MKSNKINNMIRDYKKELKKELKSLDIETLEEFFQKEKEIMENNFHKYNAINSLLNAIEKLEDKLFEE